MSFKFKLKHSNEHGLFKVNLKRELSREEVLQLSELACNVLSGEEAEDRPVYGPNQENSNQETTGEEKSLESRMFQNKLGERPVENINLGSYVEPSDGFRIKMLHLIDSNRIAAFKMLKDATGISLVGCKEIVYGNYPCPVLTYDTAATVLTGLRALNVYAKIVPATLESVA
jgi:hypothetical protein